MESFTRVPARLAWIAAAIVLGCSDAPDTAEWVTERTDAVVDPRLATHWTFDEPSGVAFDVGTDGTRDATLQNGATRAPGLPGYGSALSLDGVNDRAVFPNHVLTWGSAITIAAWMRPATTQGGAYGAMLYRLLGDDQSRVMVSSAGTTLSAKLGFSPTFVENATTDWVPANQWTHVAVRYDGSSWVWFKNGVELASSKKTQTGALSTGTKQGYFGQSGTGGGTYHYKGLLDDVRIYQAALSNEEVATLAGAAPTGPELVARWTFEGDFRDGAKSNHCSPAGGAPQIVTDLVRGKVLSLDGASSLACGNDASLDVTGAVTLAAWIKTDAPSIYDVSWPIAGKQGSYGLRIPKDGYLVFDLPGVLGNEAYAWAGLMPDVGDGQWHHVAVTYDGARVRTVFVDGRYAEATAADDGPVTMSGGVLSIGAIAGAPATAPFAGRVDDLRIYRAALAPEAIRDLADAHLVSYWSFDGAGPSAADTGASGSRSATLMAGAIRTSGMEGLGQALSLDGVDDHAIFQSPSATWGDQLTIAAWIRPSPPHGGSFGSFASRVLGDAQGNFAVSGAGTSVLAKLGLSPSSWPQLSSSAAVPANAWTHVALRYDGATLAWYVGGEQKASKPLSGALLSGTAQGVIGQNGAGGAAIDRYKGLIDELRLYDRALAPGEIWRLARPDEVHVAPAGSATAWGSPADPIDWRTAFTDSSIVHPGSTAWFAAGSYLGEPVGATSIAFEKTGLLSGTLARPIAYRAAPGARATLTVVPGQKNENILVSYADHVRWWGLEVSAGTGSGHASNDSTIGTSVWIAGGDDVKLINLVVHDNPKRTGITVQNGGTDLEVNGCLVYANGLEGSTQYYHGIYAQNATGTSYAFHDTLIFGNAGYGFHGYGQNAIGDMLLKGVVSWGNGSPTPNPGILVGTAASSTSDVTLDGCHTFFKSTAPSPHWGARLGYVDPMPNVNLVVKDSVFANGWRGASLYGWASNVSFTGNTVYSYDRQLVEVSNNVASALTFADNRYFRIAPAGPGLTQFIGDGLPAVCDFACWKAATGYDVTGSTFGPLPAEAYHLLNAYEPDREILVLYDFPCFAQTAGSCAPGVASVQVDVGEKLPLASGDAFSILSVYDPWAPPVVQGTYTEGAVISVPMTGPYAPELSVYIVRKD